MTDIYRSGYFSCGHATALTSDDPRVIELIHILHRMDKEEAITGIHCFPLPNAPHIGLFILHLDGSQRLITGTINEVLLKIKIGVLNYEA